jgi:hypothetical protein
LEARERLRRSSTNMYANDNPRNCLHIDIETSIYFNTTRSISDSLDPEELTKLIANHEAEKHTQCNVRESSSAEQFLRVSAERDFIPEDK